MSTNDLKTLIILHGFFRPETIASLEEKKDKVFVLEGRPRLESSQHAIDQLLKIGIQPTLIADNMAGFLFFRKLVKEVHLTYQEKTNDGVTTLIGGSILAIMAHKHQVPVFVYPSDIKMKATDDDNSILSFNNEQVAYQKVQGYVPLIETVPHKYITRVLS
jgi:methylthioribose-1-phosphate isomerase